MPGLVHGRPVPDVGAQYGRHQHIAAHHHAARKDHTHGGAHEIHGREAAEHHQHGGQDEIHLAYPVDEPAGHHADHGSEDQHDAQHDGVIFDPEVVLQIDNQVREKHLHRDGEHAEAREGQIEVGVGGHHFGAEPVEQVFEIAVPPGFQTGLVPHQKDGHDAHGGDGQTEDVEELPPLPRPGQPVKRAEDNQHGDQRQNGQYALHPGAVIVVGSIGDKGVKGAVVGSGAKKGHDTVHHHHQRGGGSGGIGRGKELCGVIHRDVAESRRGQAPQDIAAADKDLPSAHAVGQRAHQQRGHRGRAGRPGHHGGDVARVGGNGVIEVHIEVHIFDGPRELAEQTHQQQRGPFSCAQFVFHHVTPRAAWASR